MPYPSRRDCNEQPANTRSHYVACLAAGMTGYAVIRSRRRQHRCEPAESSIAKTIAKTFNRHR